MLDENDIVMISKREDHASNSEYEKTSDKSPTNSDRYANYEQINQLAQTDEKMRQILAFGTNCITGKLRPIFTVTDNGAGFSAFVLETPSLIGLCLC